MKILGEAAVVLPIKLKFIRHSPIKLNPGEFSVMKILGEAAVVLPIKLKFIRRRSSV